MRYLVVALTLIFSMSGSVNAEVDNTIPWDERTKWVMLTTIFYPRLDAYAQDDGLPSIQAFQTYSDNPTYKTSSEYYEDLKNYALKLNKLKGLFDGDARFRITIIDDSKIIAKAQRSFEGKDGQFYELNCLEITLD